jgi:hypothetical protein
MLPLLPSHAEETQQLRFAAPQHGTCYVYHQIDDVSGVVGFQFTLWQFECNDFRKCRLCVVAVYTEWPKKMYTHCTLILMSKECIHFFGSLCILVFFFVIKPSRCTNSTNLFCHENLHVSESSSFHHQEFIHCTLSNVICHTGL